MKRAIIVLGLLLVVFLVDAGAQTMTAADLQGRWEPIGYIEDDTFYPGDNSAKVWTIFNADSYEDTSIGLPVYQGHFTIVGDTLEKTPIASNGRSREGKAYWLGIRSPSRRKYTYKIEGDRLFLTPSGFTGFGFTGTTVYKLIDKDAVFEKGTPDYAFGTLDFGLAPAFYFDTDSSGFLFAPSVSVGGILPSSLFSGNHYNLARGNPFFSRLGTAIYMDASWTNMNLFIGLNMPLYASERIMIPLSVGFDWFIYLLRDQPDDIDATDYGPAARLAAYVRFNSFALYAAVIGSFGLYGNALYISPSVGASWAF
jgi:hypothetical protein